MSEGLTLEAGPTEVAHVRLVPPGTLLCQRCGGTYEIAMPAPLWAAGALLAGFTERHVECESGDIGLACGYCFGFGHAESACPNLRYGGNPHAWLRGRDVGMSSKAIWYRLMGFGNPDADTWTPRDPSDFGRCYRLLHAIPGWRARIGEMAGVDGWAGLVAAWDELERLYEEELPTGEAPRLYARMREILEASGG